MTGQIAAYTLEDGTVVQFEATPGPGFRPAGADEVIGALHEAVRPAVEGAKAVLDQARAAGPQKVEVKFGVKVSGTMNWVVAKAATEGNFEITLSWEPGRHEPAAAARSSAPPVPPS